MNTDFLAAGNFLNRELSWLEFNRRVLEEAQDPSQPLIERVKFLSIFASNLDEFFEIRVAGIKQQIESGTSDPGPDGMNPGDLFKTIQKKVHELIQLQYRLWNDEIVPQLAQHSIQIHQVASLTGADAEWALDYFLKEIFPLLTPLAVDASHPFPQVLNKSSNLIVRARKPLEDEPLFAIIQVPRNVQRMICLPRRKGEDEWNYIYLS